MITMIESLSKSILKTILRHLGVEIYVNFWGVLEVSLRGDFRGDLRRTLG